MWVADTGRIEGQLLNERATDYILTRSSAAQQGRMASAHESAYGLYCDVVVTGSVDQGITAAPNRLIELFDARSPDPRHIGMIYRDECGEHLVLAIDTTNPAVPVVREV